MASAASTTAGRRRTRAPARARGSTRRGHARSRFAVWKRRAALLALTTVALAAAYFGWFRDSSLVAVENVRVEGVTSNDESQIVAALTHAARGMTTLHVDADRLAAAVRGFPAVASVSADTSLPHGMTIHVTERRPALVVSAGGQVIPVSADGTLLPGLDVGGAGLPTLSLDEVPQGGELQGEALQQALVLGAAPGALRPLIDGAAMTGDYGVVVSLHGGIDLRFGDASGAKAKWAAASAVLADPALTTTSYVDVSVPDRPGVGGSDDPTPASAPGAADPAATTSTVPAAP